MLEEEEEEEKEKEGIQILRRSVKWHCLWKKFNVSILCPQTNALFVHFRPDVCIYMNKMERSEIRHNKLKAENVIEIQIRFR